MSVSIKLTKLSTVLYYLSKLQSNNLITPSIGKSFPDNIQDKEQQIIHKSYLKIQQHRINEIQKEYTAMIDSGFIFCWDTFWKERKRFDKQNSIPCE